MPLADNRIGVWRLHAVPEKSLNRLGSTVVVAAVVALLVPCVRAQETPWTRQDALHEASSEAAQCQAYYSFAQKCADNAGQTALSAQLQQAIDSASKFQFMSGKAAGMSNEAMLASLKLALDVAKDSISNSCVNISVLIVKYSNPCQFLLEHPDDRIQTLMRGPPRATGQ
jgi:ABC-type arginine/histidine transport system permease subunit